MGPGPSPPNWSSRTRRRPIVDDRCAAVAVQPRRSRVRGSTARDRSRRRRNDAKFGDTAAGSERLGIRSAIACVAARNDVEGLRRPRRSSDIRLRRRRRRRRGGSCFGRRGREHDDRRLGVRVDLFGRIVRIGIRIGRVVRERVVRVRIVPTAAAEEQLATTGTIGPGPGAEHVLARRPRRVTQPSNRTTRRSNRRTRRSNHRTRRSRLPQRSIGQRGTPQPALSERRCGQESYREHHADEEGSHTFTIYPGACQRSASAADGWCVCAEARPGGSTTGGWSMG